MMMAHLQCQLCGEAFSIVASQVRHGKGKYCGFACSNKAARTIRWAGNDPVKNFWALVDRSGGDDACWPWLGGSRMKAGYGRVIRDGKTIGAHRYALLVTVGDPPAGKPFACHRCDNPACCNPAHLRWDSPKANMDDRSRRDWRNPRAKIDREKVYSRWLAGESKAAIARDLSVAQSTVGRAVERALLKALETK